MGIHKNFINIMDNFYLRKTPAYAEGVLNFRCPITHELMETPFMTPCGHTYERNAIEAAILTNNKCPTCNTTITDPSKLVSNFAVKCQINEFDDKVTKAIDKNIKINDIENLLEIDEGHID